jgi:hypothetical protein
MDVYLTPGPWMPPIKNLANFGPVGVPSPRCTTPSVRTAVWVTDHRHRKLFPRQCRPTVPLRFTSGQHWRGRQSCTNNQAGPLDGGRSEVRRELALAVTAEPYAQLLLLSHLFCWFGKLHPFLDGNGHIQRSLFAAAAIEIGIPLSSRFAIHPRSNDRLLAWPLELFTRALPDQREQFLAMVAEYISCWLSEPFDMPASGIPPA